MTEPSHHTSSNTCPSAADLIRRGESLTVEFKSDRKCLPDRELVEALAAMANSQGGVVLLGVEDDGTVTGLHKAHADAETGIPPLVESRTGGLTISSPGGLIEGITTETLLTAAPRSRNPLLADAVKRIGLAERTGRGIDRIYEGVLRNGRPAPDFSATNEATFSVTMAAVPADLSFVRMLQNRPDHGVGLKADALLEIAGEHPIETPEGLTDNKSVSSKPLSPEGMIVAHVREQGSITVEETMELCGVKSWKAKDILRRLCEKNVLIHLGTRRTSRYEINA